ncbi:MAG: hypothetical protein AAF718_06955 [Pseudomonadota bacterium]
MTTHVLHATGLRNVSEALQELHKQLLRFQAEQAGFFGSPLELFERATKDQSFAWLKPLREEIVALDERRADEEPISDAETKAYCDRFRNLLDVQTGPFREKINVAFQSDPETIWAVGSVRKTLDALS